MKTRKWFILFILALVLLVPAGAALADYRDDGVIKAGETIAEAGTEPGFIIADIDRAVVTQVRDRVPALKHDRAFKVVEAGSDPGRGAKL